MIRSTVSSRALIALVCLGLFAATPISPAFASAPGTGCTMTFGFWETHPEIWPLFNLNLGTVPYNSDQLGAILAEPDQGNGLVSLAHQLIAVRFNLAFGSDSTAIAAPAAAADLMVGALVVPPAGTGYLSPDATRALTRALADWNGGVTGPGECETTGACCYADGTCFMSASSDCAIEGGVYEGDGVACDARLCVPTAVQHTTWGAVRHSVSR